MSAICEQDSIKCEPIRSITAAKDVSTVILSDSDETNFDGEEDVLSQGHQSKSDETPSNNACQYLCNLHCFQRACNRNP